ncbi:MAG: geranylgeranylglycerol-phosphate geranylgeranyltransferase [Candidatus Hodarchaeales archaeon]|jgi:geranylgeranylglycerol-phosphate geranylgeranyltransferase
MSNNKLIDFLALIRFPLGVMAAISGLAAGFVVIRLQEPLTFDLVRIFEVYWPNIIVGMPIPALIVWASMAINDYYDLESDLTNNRLDRPLVRKTFSPNVALYSSIIMFILGALLSVLLINIGELEDNYFVVIFTIAFIFIGISYSTWLKKYGFLGNIGVSLSYPAAIILGGFVVGFKNDLAVYTIIAFGLLIFFSALGREVLKGIMDVEGDRVQGVKTIAIRYGEKNAATFTFVLYLISIVFAPIPLFLGLKDHTLSMVFYIGCVALMIGINIYTSYKLMKNPSKENSIKGRKHTKIAFWFAVLGYFASAVVIGI